ncbi:hypothetical protein RhiirA5_478341 [Rhizophagus irregularis]|uniref:Uncharacterized protein n=1 Tax=Rhizophagus irregularis TaxID=588596 RepID=A0A2N0PMB4_9GLOM|nr:hypothetical protein RhiirA5_478341 [Rhizophagus irregularis]CAB5213412.1 unnamed protein product [Rhizophagus irregularis]
MNSNNQNTQDYCNLQTDQTGNSPSPQQIPNNNNNNENIQHTLINNVGVSNMNLNTLHVNTINSTTLAPHNIIFEFYYHLPNDARIYRVTYSELNPSENVQLLNNGINRIPDYLLTHHYNVQSQIQQQIQQQVQHSIIYQQNSIQQRSFDTTQPIPQVYSNSDTYNAAVNGTVSYDMQDMGDTGFQNSS